MPRPLVSVSAQPDSRQWLDTGSLLQIERFHRLLPVVVILAFVVGAAFVWYQCRRNPSIPFLPSESGAEWIVSPEEISIAGQPRSLRKVWFRKTFLLPEGTHPGRVRLRAFREAALWVNDKPIFWPEPAKPNWKLPRECDVSHALRAGTNTVEVHVSNTDGLPALWLILRTDAQDVKTDRQWEARTRSEAWSQARLASEPTCFPKELSFPTVLDGWRKAGPVVLVWLLLAFLVTGLSGRYARRRSSYEGSDGGSSLEMPIRMKWILAGGVVVLWAAMCINNLFWLPASIGFDSDAHLWYINYLLSHYRLPVATQGWEAYQPPFYYVISASLISLGKAVGLPSADTWSPRVVSMASGLANVLLVWSAACLLFPRRPGTQLAALLLATAMPMNLYMSHYPSNETLCAAMVLAGMVLALHALRDNAASWTRYAKLGVVLGLGMLSKFTALLAVVAILTVLGIVALRRPYRRWRGTFQTVGITVAAMLLVCGWYYWRNWTLFRNPFLGNWDAASGTSWHAAPGYGTSAYYLRFGRSLTQPFQAWIYSYADSIFTTVWGDAMFGGNPTLDSRPPWNYGLMGIGYTFAWIPTSLIVAGLILMVVQKASQVRTLWALLIGHAGLVAFAVWYMTLKLPYFSQAKGFYGLSCMTCLCCLGAAGFEYLTNRRMVRTVLWVLLLTWAFNSYASYFIVPPDARTHVGLAIQCLNKGDEDRADWHLLRAMRLEPETAGSTFFPRIEFLCKHKRYPQARRLIEGALACPSLAPAAHVRLMAYCLSEGDEELGDRHLLEAIRRTPEAAGTTLLERFQSLLKQKRYRQSRRLIEDVLAIRPDAELALHLAIELLAGCPDDQTRDGRRALQLAETLCRLSGPDDPFSLHLLAIAQAELGRFDEAIQTLHRAIRLAQSIPEFDEKGLKDMHKHARLFESHRPYRLED